MSERQRKRHVEKHERVQHIFNRVPEREIKENVEKNNLQRGND